MATRAYVRNSRGQFAGAKGGRGTKVTYGKAGGFANANFRSRVQANRKNSRPPAKGKTTSRSRRKKPLTTRVKTFAKKNPVLASYAVSYGVAVGVGGGIAAYGAAGQKIGTMAAANRAARTAVGVSKAINAPLTPSRKRRGAYNITSAR